MDAAWIAGRVGTLALALGVGVVVTGGVASATEGTGDTGPSSSESSSQSQDPGSGGSETGSETKESTDKPTTESEHDTEADTAEPDDTEAATNESEAEPSEQPTAETEAPEATTDAAAPEQSEVAATPEPTPTETAVEADTATETPSPQESEVPSMAAPTETSAAPKPTDVVTHTTSTRGPAEQTPEPKTQEPTPTASARTVETVADDSETPVQTTVESKPSTHAVALSVAGTGTTALTQPKSLLAGVVEAVGAIVNSVVTGVLGLFGITPTASGLVANNPLAAAVISLLGWGARRETVEDKTETSVASPEVATALAVTTAAVAAPTTIQVAWLTGATSINNTLARFGIYGTDLGIMWDNGVTGDNPATAIVEQHQILMAFGDTFTNAAMTTGWRSNVLLRTADNVLSDGIKVPDGIPDKVGIPIGAYSGSPMDPGKPNYARQIIGKYPYTWWTQVTVIPTGAISVAGAGANGATRQYVSFMSVNQWGWPGSWTTNYSAIAYSDDNGQNWTQVPQSSVRSGGWLNSTVPYVSGNERFQMVSFVKPPEDSADAAAGYVYAYGTPSGRSGTVHLSRVQSTQILDVSKYQYWTGSKWVTNSPSSAKPVLPGTTSSFLGIFKWTTYPSAGELSVQYNDYLKKYVMLYTDSSNNVQLRTSDAPNGTWSAPTTLATSAKYPGLYAPMIHPWSGTNQLKKSDGSAEDPQYLYWNMSLWGNYNVTLMRTDLSSLLTVV